MRYPQHLILDHSFLQNQKSQNTWANLYIKQISRDNKLAIAPKSEQKGNSSQFSNAGLSFPTTLFDINFLRKDKIYTKLKYSRCPQYDIVSGGWAALFAGLLGFLISEKFGIELVDSGDFYTVFMYGVFLCFSTRPLLRILDKNSTWTQVFTLKSLAQFLLQLVTLFFKAIRSYARAFKRS
jgi:hypothetical protein